MIEFLQDYTTEATPPEVFKLGQQVERSEASELYFVRRGLAGFVINGKLCNEDGDTIDLTARQADPATEGQPPHASSGPLPSDLFTTTALASPALEAEVQRLTQELSDANAEGDDLAKELEGVRSDLQTAQDQMKLMQDDLLRAEKNVLDAVDEKTAVEAKLATANGHIVELEAALAEATKPTGDQGSEESATSKSGKAAK